MAQWQTETAPIRCNFISVMMSNTFSIPSSKHLALNVDKLKAEYQELMKQKNELTSTYKKCEKEVQSLNRKLENLNQYLGQTQPDFTSEQSRKKNNPIL